MTSSDFRERLRSTALVLGSVASLGGCASLGLTPLSGPLDVGPTPLGEAYGDYLTARYASLSSDPETAAERYRNSLIRMPERDEVLERSVVAALSSGDYKAALRTAQSRGLTGPGSAQMARLVLVIEAFRRAKYDDALALLDGAEFSRFNQILAQSITAWALAGQGDTAGAVTQITRKSPGGAFINQLNLLGASFILLHAGEDEEALRALNMSIEHRVGLHAAYDVHARLLASRGQMDKAIELLEFAREEMGDHPLIHQAEKEIVQTGTLVYTPPGARSGLLNTLLAPTGALTNAVGGDAILSYMELLHAIDPDNHAMTVIRSRALERDSRPEEAISVLKAVPVSSPYHASAMGQLAWIYARQDDRDKALDAAARAAALEGGRMVDVEIGDVYRSLEDYAAAEAVLLRVRASDRAQGREEDWRVTYALGACRHQLGKWELAETDLKRALDLAPEQPQVLNYLGYSWVDRGENIDEAFRLIQTAVDLQPGAGYIVDSLGWAYYRLGRYEEAVTYLERATSLDPDDPVINDHLGDAYWRIGKRDQARFQWERVKLFDPPEELLHDVDRKLREGLEDVATSASLTSSESVLQ